MSQLPHVVTFVAGVFLLGHIEVSSAMLKNIFVFLVDDMGYCDHQACDPEMRTPNIRRLQETGVTLNQSYVLQVCAPTRAAFLTARYPYTYGMQQNQIKGASMAWLNTSLKLFPEYLREHNYTTHKVGKWHLGHCHYSLTQLWRGFDTDFGFYTNSLGFFNHSGKSPFSYDFRNQTELFFDHGTYATDLYVRHIQSLIVNRDKSRPFFIYYAMQNVHYPYETKQEYLDTVCAHVRNPQRRIRCGMMWAADNAVGKIINTLTQQGILDQTVILLMSDNGGPLEGGSSNWPLRSQKATLWEGGTRAFTVLRSSKLRSTNVTFKGMIHAVDWLPTLMSAAGATPPSTGLHGKDLWSRIEANSRTGRTEFVYNMDDKADRYCIRWRQWKYCKGVPGAHFGWYPPASLEVMLRGQVFSGDKTWGDIDFGRNFRREYLGSTTFLFNIEEDPQEIYNLKDNHQSLVEQLDEKLLTYKMSLSPWVEAGKAPTAFLVKYNSTFGYQAPGFCNP